MAVSRMSIIKFLELAITIACIGLHYQSQTTNSDTELVTMGTFGGYLIILIGGAAGHLMSAPINRKVDVFFCLAGVACFIATGALNIKYFENAWKGETRNYGLAKASLAIINGAIFLVDSLLAWRGDY